MTVKKKIQRIVEQWWKYQVKDKLANKQTETLKRNLALENWCVISQEFKPRYSLLAAVFCVGHSTSPHKKRLQGG